MMLFKYDENGIYQYAIIIDEIDESVVLSNVTEVEPPFHLHRAKWTGTEWVEDMTQEEINEIKNRSKIITREDYLLDIDFRLSMIELGL